MRVCVLFDESVGGDHIRLTNWFGYVCPCTPLYLLTLSFNKRAWEGNFLPMVIIVSCRCVEHILAVAFHSLVLDYHICNQKFSTLIKKLDFSHERLLPTWTTTQ